MARRKWSWTQLNLERAKQVETVTDELFKYWPLTLRQVFYQLVAKGKIENTRSQYNMLSKLVKWMRIDGMLPWNAIEDRSRTVTDKKGYEDLNDFIQSELDYFLEGYSRCLVQGQQRYLEVWTEKDALFRIFHGVVYPYCIRTVVCRGYSSVSFIADFYARAAMALDKGQQPVVLYFGDLDPSGVQMLEATIETLEGELGLSGVEFKRVGLNPEHIELYKLPNDPTDIKISDTRYPKYVKKYGKVAVELDALHPKELENMIRNAIESEIDMDLLEKQIKQGEEEQALLSEKRERCINIINKVFGLSNT